MMPTQSPPPPFERGETQHAVGYPLERADEGDCRVGSSSRDETAQQANTQ